MRRVRAILRRYGMSIAVFVVLGLAWLGSIFAGDMVFVNLPGLGRTFTCAQSRGMVGFSSQNRKTTVDFICSYPIFGSPSTPVSLWRNPHGSPSFDVPLPVYWEVQANYWSFGVSYWFLGGGFWLGRRLWGSRREKKLSLEMAALPQ